MRFFCIAPIVIWHVAGRIQGFEEPWVDTTLYKGLTAGTIGVPLFFVISGFILVLPFVEHYTAGGRAPRLGRYYLRRVTRLEPPYLLSVLLIAAAGVYLGDQHLPQAWPHILATLGYANGAVYHAHSSVDSITWSLEVEIQFYILLPLLAMIFRIRNTAGRRGIMVVVATAAGLRGAGVFSWAG